VDEDSEALDWTGRLIDCAVCPHVGQAVCELGKACVNDRRARRIERFFMANRALADNYLDHPYFEVRALAGRHCNVFRLQRLVNDPEPEPRASAALRLPLPRAMPMKADADRRVRVALASRLAGQAQLDMTQDPDGWVRMVVARRLPPELLIVLRGDVDPEVRRIAARRMTLTSLPAMVGDPDPMVRLEVAERLPPPLMYMFAGGGVAATGIPVPELHRMGYRLFVDSQTPLLAMHHALRDSYAALKALRADPLLGADGQAEQQAVHETIDLETLLAIERRTVER